MVRSGRKSTSNRLSGFAVDDPDPDVSSRRRIHIECPGEDDVASPLIGIKDLADGIITCSHT